MELAAWFGVVVATSHILRQRRARDVLKRARKGMISVIALTGGPCAGKSTALGFLRENLPKKMGIPGDIDVYMVPEVPTLLMEGNAMYPGSDAGQLLLDFEVSLMRMQLEVERAFYDIAVSKGRRAVLLCDRGAMDIKAYVTAELWENILIELKETDDGLLARYGKNITLILVRLPHIHPIFHDLLELTHVNIRYTLSNLAD
jgi:hypothetical protein